MSKTGTKQRALANRRLSLRRSFRTFKHSLVRCDQIFIPEWANRRNPDILAQIQTTFICSEPARTGRARGGFSTGFEPSTPGVHGNGQTAPNTSHIRKNFRGRRLNGTDERERTGFIVNYVSALAKQNDPAFFILFILILEQTGYSWNGTFPSIQNMNKSALP
ncbi:hypothetical protein TNIN_161801 [Trichonephila inaurata madagascariensis]|uniref:Uncharacterized protein n=1 Tax=Trichonephila inaurata madagascariensis TaxID=2747483 RepID=A0A8X7CSR6_9ARAC|nr:hypothetical protein TNIN_161801 [Trichonephila inaurata madagascariensis]